MPLRTTPSLTDKLYAILAGVEDLFDMPRSMRQVVYRLEYEHYKHKRRRSEKEKRERGRIQRALSRLEKAEYVVSVKEGDSRHYRLTPQGWLTFAVKYAKALRSEERVGRKAEEASGVSKGSYVVIFDIPEEYRRFRDVLRTALVNLGCKPVQKSIFITHEIKVVKFVARIIANCELEDRVKILLVKSIL